MICSQCGEKNETAANFCVNCGAKLVKKCPQCGSTNIERKKYCPNCGANLKLLLFNLSMAGHSESRTDFKESDLDNELELYKNELKKGSVIITCPQCQVKNRLPKNAPRKNARCGKCGGEL